MKDAKIPSHQVDVVEIMYSQLARAIFVGKTNVVPEYSGSLIELRMNLGLMPEDILFAGHGLAVGHAHGKPN